MSRADRAADLAAQRELGALLVRDPTNLRWLTGFTGTNGLCVLEAGVGGRVFVTDFRYVERAADEVFEEFERRRGERDLLDSITEALPGRRPLRLGFDDANTSVRDHRRLQEALGDGVELVAAGGLIESLRAVKDENELQAIRAAAHVADEALRETLERGIAGRTEREVALELEDGMRRRGAQEPSFFSIVAAGPRGALPHAEPGDDPISRHTLVVIDFGARLDGYCSDCTRTVATGEVDADLEEVYELVRRAQLAGLRAVSAGTSGRDADAAARAVIEEAGYGEQFGHGLGHGVGLLVHEGPRLAKSADDVLEPGNVVTVEPGVYLPGRVGVRIEDLVVVTDDGPKILSSYPKALTVVD